jgi:hypothetical protein
MRAFLVAVNAQLPVDNPDQTLLALAQSNGAAKCAPEHALYHSATSPTLSPANKPIDGSRLRAEATPSEALLNSGGTRAPSTDRPLSERAWAPAEMLVPPKSVARPSVAVVPLTVGSAAPVLQTDTSSSTDAQVIPVERGQTTSQLEPAAGSQVSPAPKVARRRAKSRRHKNSDYDEVSRSVSKGLNSIQRSLSSMFD